MLLKWLFLDLFKMRWVQLFKVRKNECLLSFLGGLFFLLVYNIDVRLHLHFPDIVILIVVIIVLVSVYPLRLLSGYEIVVVIIRVEVILELEPGLWV